MRVLRPGADAFRRGTSTATLTAVLAASAWTTLPAWAADGAITGVVTGADGTPVPGVRVELPLVQDGCPVRRTATTDAEGRYTLSDVPAGDYFGIRFSTDDHRYVATSYLGGAEASDQKTPVRVAGDAPARADAQLVEASTLSGQVTDSTGRPVHAQVVLLRPRSFPGGFSYLEFSAFRSTGGDGSYSFTRQAPGTATTFVFGARAQTATSSTPAGDGFAGDGALLAGDAQRVQLVPGQTADLDARLPEGRRLRLALTPPDDAPLPSSVHAIAARSDIGFGNGSSRGSDGVHTVDSLSAATRTVGVNDLRHDGSAPEYARTVVRDAQGAPVVLTPAVAPEPVAVPVERGYQITGVVTDVDGTPGSGLSVSASGTSHQQPGFATTDSEGRYRLAGLQAGSYRLSFNGWGTHSHYRDTLRQEEALLVPVGPAPDAPSAPAPYERVATGTVGVDQRVPAQFTAPVVCPDPTAPSRPVPTPTPTPTASPSPSPTGFPSPSPTASPSPSPTGSAEASPRAAFPSPTVASQTPAASSAPAPSPTAATTSPTPATTAAAAPDRVAPAQGPSTSTPTTPAPGSSATAASSSAPAAPTSSPTGGPAPEQTAATGAAVAAAVEALPALPAPVHAAVAAALVGSVQELAGRTDGDPAALQAALSNVRGAVTGLAQLPLVDPQTAGAAAVRVAVALSALPAEQQVGLGAALTEAVVAAASSGLLSDPQRLPVLGNVLGALVDALGSQSDLLTPAVLQTLVLGTAEAAVRGGTAGDLQGLRVATSVDRQGALVVTVEGLAPDTLVVTGADVPSRPARSAAGTSSTGARQTVSLNGRADRQGRAVLRSAAGSVDPGRVADAVLSLAGTSARGTTAVVASTGRETAPLAPPQLSTSVSTLAPGAALAATVRSAPGVRVQLLGRDVHGLRALRSGTTGADGVLRWVLRPGRHTTLVVRAANTAGAVDSAPRGVWVTSRLSGRLVRTDRSAVLAQGALLPRRAQALVVVSGREVGTGRTVLLGRTRTRPDGTWSVSRRFTGRALLEVQAQVAADGHGGAARLPLGRVQVG